MKNTFKVVKELESRINLLMSSEPGESLVRFYVKRFNLPKQIILQYIKQRIASNFNMKYSKFLRVITLPYLFFSIFKYLVFLLVVLFFSKKVKLKLKRDVYDLLIDDMQHKGEIERWLSLENEFSKEKIIFIARSDEVKTSEDNNIITRKPLKGYDRSFLLKDSPNLFISDLCFLIWNSFRLNINLVHLHSLFIND